MHERLQQIKQGSGCVSDASPSWRAMRGLKPERTASSHARTQFLSTARRCHKACISPPPAQQAPSISWSKNVTSSSSTGRHASTHQCKLTILKMT